jgi:LacI family transcriptional regulator
MVRGDSLGGAIQLTRHLMDLGHQKITILAGPRDVSTSVDRVKGFQLALQEGGLTIDSDAVKWGNFSHQSGYEMTRQAFESSIRPTALFATNNFIAIGALRALRELDLRVPEEISVVAYSDIPLGIEPFPFLTVATHDDYDMGYQATKLLLRRLSGEEQVEFQEIIMPAEIIIRQSTAQVPELK